MLHGRAVQAEDLEAGGAAGTEHQAQLGSAGCIQTATSLRHPAAGSGLQTGSQGDGVPRFRRPPPPPRSTAEATVSGTFGTSSRPSGSDGRQGDGI